MLNQAIKKIKSIILILTSKEDKLLKDYLSTDNQKTLVRIKDFLKNFYNVIEVIEDRNITLDRVLFIIDYILEYFKEVVEEFINYNALRELVYTRWTKILKYQNKIKRLPVYIVV